MNPGKRVQLLVVAAWLAFFGLGTRLYALQVRHADEMRSRAERRRRRVDFLPPRRGRIVDRHGNPLALDRAVEDVVVEMTELDPALDLVPRIGRATRAPIHEVAAQFREAREQVRDGARAARVGVARDEAARQRIEKLAPRWGLSLAQVPEGWAVFAPASLVGARDRALGKLAELLQVEAPQLRVQVQAREDEIRAIPDGAEGKGRYERMRAWGEPLVVASDVDFDRAAAIEEASVDTPGFAVVRRFVRRYPRGTVAAHLAGFLGSLNDAEAATLRKDGRLVDESEDAGGLLFGLVKALPEGARLRSQPVGRAGLEAKLDKRLAGLPGARVVERDASDRSRVTFLDVNPRDGEDVALTLDLEEQACAEAALDEALRTNGDPAAGGAACVLDVATGEVLVLASAPRFDPNDVASAFGALDKDPAKPFCHRAVAAVPPGSTFKVLSSLAYFSDGRLSLGWRSDCFGALVPGHKAFHCDDDHGAAVELSDALARSCNVFFFRAADACGSEPLVEWGERVGFGTTSGGAIPLEQAGHIPGGVGPMVRNAAIGQGEVRATPLQVARLAQLIANGGTLPGTRLLRDSEAVSVEVAIDSTLLERIREGLRGCVTRGTASKPSIGLCALDVAGKTGTAERGKGHPNYAWFMGYYPASRPEIAFSVLVDRTNAHGGDVCGPVARKLIESYARSRGEEPKRR
ncbi:MAG TPA: penicillin-binding transpeptidase domain-containing protein [Planctomycetota bacterium]|nr:penicillin-binding transpeptidase domain-containing protein [Planctomycetota bacterium]